MYKSTTLALLPAAVIAFAAPARGDPGDADFVQQLSAAGIHISDPPPLVGNTAHLICQLLGDYKWPVSMASGTVKHEYPNLSESQDRTFVLLAQKNYCPTA